MKLLNEGMLEISEDAHKLGIELWEKIFNRVMTQETDDLQIREMQICLAAVLGLITSIINLGIAEEHRAETIEEIYRGLKEQNLMKKRTESKNDND